MPPFTTLTFLIEALTKSYSHISARERWCAREKCGTACFLTEGGHCALCVTARARHSTSFISPCVCACLCLLSVCFSCVKVRDTFHSFQHALPVHAAIKHAFKHLNYKAEQMMAQLFTFTAQVIFFMMDRKK